jgi:hypothetical protein
VARVAARATGGVADLPARNPLAYLFALFVPRTMAGAGAASMLMMVAVIGIIAAIAIPSLLRARVSANEAGALGDLRTMVSAQVVYESATGSFGLPECLAAPSQPGCITGYAASQPTFLDPTIVGSPVRGGYRRVFVPGPAKPTQANPNGIAGFCYGAAPIQPGQTGVRSFAVDHTGLICFDRSGEDLCREGALPYGCTPLN